MRDVLVPVLIHRLVSLHGVDPARLAAELDGKVRTRTWPGTDPARRVIAALPDGFPRFKGEVVDGRLRVTGMRLVEDAVFSTGATYARMDLPAPPLPETLVAAIEGRPLDRVLAHAAIDPATVVSSVTISPGRDGAQRMVLGLEMPHVSLIHEPGPAVAATETPEVDVDALVGITHEMVPDAPAMDAARATDPRTWAEATGHGWRMVGVRNERSAHDGGPVLAIRFPYDRRTVAALSRSGCGAWFDRDTYSWRLVPRPTALSRLSAFLDANADVVVSHDGRLHIHKAH